MSPRIFAMEHKLPGNTGEGATGGALLCFAQALVASAGILFRASGPGLDDTKHVTGRLIRCLVLLKRL